MIVHILQSTGMTLYSEYKLFNSAEIVKSDILKAIGSH